MGLGAAAAVLVSVGLGAILAVQGPVTALLGRGLASPVSATLVSLLVSTSAAVALHVTLAGAPRWGEPPLWSYVVDGLVGIAFVFGSLLMIPRLGSATFLACVILGQLAAGLLLDHLAAFGLPGHPVTLGRVAAIGCILAGVVLLRAS